MSNPSLRDQLKAQFADHQVPSGKDFADLINAALIPADDGLAFNVNQQTVSVQHPARFEQTLLGVGDARFNGALNADGSLTVAGASQLQAGLAVRGASQLQTLQVSGDSALAGTLTLDGSLDARQTATLQDTLNVHGATSLLDNLNVGRDSTLHGVLNVKQHTTLDGDLAVAGRSQLQQGADIRNGLNVSGNVHLHDALLVGEKLDVDGALFVADTLQVKKDATIGGSLRLKSGERLLSDHLAAACEHDTITIDSLAHFNKPLTAASSLQVNAAANLGGALAVGGDSQLAGKLNVDKDASFAQQLSVGGHSALQGTLAVQGLAQFAAGLSLQPDTLLKTDQLAARRDGGTLQIGSPTTINQPLTAADTLHVGAAANLAGALNVGGDAAFAQQLAVGGHSALQGTLAVQGLAQFAAGLELHPDTQLKTDLLAARRDGGTLQIGSPTTINQPLTAADTLHVGAAANLAGALNVGGDAAFAQQLAVGGHSALQGTLAVQGLAQFAAGLELHPDTQLKTDLLAARRDGGTLQIGSPTTISQPLTAADTLHVGAAANLAGTLNVGGDSQLAGALAVGHDTRLDGQLAVAKDTTLHAALNVKGDSHIEQHLKVGRTLDVAADTLINGTATVNGGIQVSHSDKEQAPLEIRNCHEQFSPLLVSASGNVGINTAAPSAQLQLTARPQRDLLLLQRVDGDGLALPALHVNAVGQLAIGRLQASEALDVNGNAEINGRLHTTGDLDIDGKALLNQAEVETSLIVNDKTHLKGTLEVDGGASFDNGQTTFGLATFHHEVDIKSSLNVAAAANVHGDGDIRGTLRVRGSLGADSDASIGGALAVAKGGNIKGGLTVSDGSTLKGGLAVSDGSSLKGGLALDKGVRVDTLSDDPYLGEEAASDSALATQKAVKAYVDTYASPFGRGGRSWSIRTQAEFEQVFGNGSGEKTIADNSSIILLPPREYGHSHPLTRLDGSRIAPNSEEWQAIPAYVLKNAVRLGSGVTITGFNQDAVRIVKQDAACRLLLEGSSQRPLSRVVLDGFTFDGRGLPFSGHGGAISLRAARDIRIGARLLGHVARGNGGALFAEDSRRVYADNIHACFASSDNTRQRLSFGGAAFGLADSEIHASRCYADVGGAVAQCHDSVVQAQGCVALYGGGAYSCERLTLDARYCTAHYQGGGAYGCADLTASGYWRGNYSAAFGNRNIVAYSGNRQWFLWRGDFIERRIEPGWHCHDL